ncbi:expressed unknown protein [Seminavis robusta]|uniref:Uncharacterized protein n=1 Tax=Seminavis robusta TaxID=568900 RepID=A0A9N8HQ13_9STRA|nr:expressed unknown protein [Seminavis robusta]|eukprot:Sro1388_g268430.1 n/a (197) ;mRNA; f:2769-3359
MTKLSLLAATLLAGACSSVESFSVLSSRPTRSSSTRLNLVPEQGKQLEAAVTAAYAKAEEESSSSSTATLTPPPCPKKRLSSARAFVSRVFSLPSVIRGHPHPKLEGLSEDDAALETTTWEWQDGPQDDVVLFPLVGFQFVQDAPNHYGVLPSSTACNPSCRLRTNAADEEHVGWFSKACHLQNLYADNYCEEPTN